MNLCLLKIPSQTWEVFLSKKPAGSDLLSSVAEIQEATGLNFVFDRLNACVSSVKQTLELYYKKISLCLVRLQIRGILYSVNEERNQATRREKEVYFINFVFTVRLCKN